MSTTKPKAKPGKEVVYVDHDDEITTIIDKVDATKQKVVALVLPKRFTTLQSIVNMRLLKRSADTAGKSVVLITSEQALLPLAGVAGLHIARNLQTKPEIPPSPIVNDEGAPVDEPTDPDTEVDTKGAKLDYHRSIGELAASHEVEEPDAIPLGGDEQTAGTDKPGPGSKKDKKLKVPNFDRFRLLLAAGLLGLIALIVFLVLATKVLPKAIIIIKTTSIPVAADFTLTASDTVKALDVEKKQIPAVLRKSDQTSNQQVQATGQKNQGEKATGTVVLKNCGANSATIPAGSGVNSGGLTFITQKTVTLDSGNFTPPPTSTCKTTGGHIGSVSVTAQSPGSKYNIGPSSFTVSGFSSVTGSSSNPMTGGTDSILTIVAQQDLDSAKKKITAADSDKFSADFQKQLGDEGFYVLSSTLKLGDPVVTATPAVGQEATNVSVSIKITYSVLVVPKADLEKAITDALNKQFDKSKQKLSDGDVLDKVKVSVVNQTAPTTTNLEISIDTTAIPIIDEDTVKKQIAGKKDGEIRKILTALPGVKEVQTKMSPFWVAKAPSKPSKVNIVVEQAEESRQ
ncbi:hypothetical protein H0X09_01330 [Candidatus Saccharibacteria bacterium]|nr:hypothetical protein [Candidatus Saccharibacteria bacterium]